MWRRERHERRRTLLCYDESTDTSAVPVPMYQTTQHGNQVDSNRTQHPKSRRYKARFCRVRMSTRFALSMNEIQTG